jgi:hypothetical protein
MNKEEMIDGVKEDLKHIPEGPDFARQGELRMLYNKRRRQDVLDSKSRKETITHCLEFLKRDERNRTWQPNFEIDYFLQ